MGGYAFILKRAERFYDNELQGEDKIWTPGPWTPSLDRIHGPPIYLFIYFILFLIFIFHFLFFFFFYLSIFFFYKKINHTKPNHSDWVHGHPIFPSFKISSKEILLYCFLLATRGGCNSGTKCLCFAGQHVLLMIGIIKVTGLHDSYVREICTLAVLCSVF